MKKIYQLTIAFVMVLTLTKAKAQCDLTLSNLQIQIVGTPVVLGPSKCEVTFNAQFDIAVNGGFKVLYFHSWLAADYPVTPIFDCGNSNAQDPGTTLQLGTAVDQIGKSFLDMGFVNVPTTGALNVVQPLTFSTNFIHSPTVTLTQPSNSPGITASKYFNGTADHYTVNNIKVIINTSCTSSISVKTDIWGSNSNAPDPKAQCYICGLASFFNDPTITGFKNCGTPLRQYALGISTLDPVAKNITYKIFVDMNDNGQLDIGTDELAFTSGTVSVSSGSPFSVGLTSLPSPYSDTYPYSEKGYIILVEGPTLSNSIVDYFPHPSGCLVLPVELKSFNATRNRSNVLLKWVTSTEINNRGFSLERNAGNSGWKEIAYIPSQAAGGNSTTELEYTYTDMNMFKGVTQYRLKQTDIDNRIQYSEIRSVRGDGQLGKTIIYPNPTSNGTVNVLFEESNIVRDIVVTDMSGRAVKIMKGITSNNVIIDNLTPGMYSIRIVAVETGAQVVEKVVVNKR